jgi:uncharacterized membrane protein
MTLETVVVVAAAVLAALAGGFHFTFSAMVLPGFRTLPPAEAMTTMRRINIAAVRAPFVVIFFGGAISFVAVIITEVVSGGIVAMGPLRAIGAVLALAGFVITIVWNVPLNNGLALDSPNTTSRWIQFDRDWGRANGIRSAASIAGTIALTASLAGN